jgi:hypothetical protein
MKKKPQDKKAFLTLKSKFSGKCKVCNGAYEKGETVKWLPGQTIHPNCEAKRNFFFCKSCKIKMPPEIDKDHFINDFFYCESCLEEMKHKEYDLPAHSEAEEIEVKIPFSCRKCLYVVNRGEIVFKNTFRHKVCVDRIN